MKGNHFKIYIVITIIILIIGISIAYATLSQTLKVNSTTTIQSSKTSWNIAFVSGNCKISGYGDVGNLSYTDTTVTISGFSLKAPGDRCDCTIKVQNKGEINAKLSSITPIYAKYTVTGSNAEEDKTFVFYQSYRTISYLDGRSLNTGDVLKAGESVDIIFSYGFPMSVNSLPTNEVQLDGFGYTLNYVQAN